MPTEPMFRAPVLTTIYDACRQHTEDLNIRVNEIPYDDAADLSNNIWGGPVVHVQEVSTSHNRDGYMTRHAWQLTVMAFIVEEGLDVIGAVEEILRKEGPQKYKNFWGHNWRFRDGALVPDDLGAS